MELLFYPVIVAALLLPAAWLWWRGVPLLQATAIGAAFGVLLWGGVALLRFFVVLPGSPARNLGLAALTLSAGLVLLLWRLTRQTDRSAPDHVPTTTWAAIGGGAAFVLGLEVALPHFGVVQWSFDWWMHFDLARFYLTAADPWRVYPSGDVISGRTPLYNLLGSLALEVFGNRFSVLQVLTAAVGWLWLLPAALLTRRLCGPGNKVLPLLALSPLVTFSNVYTWPKGLLMLLLLLALERVLELRVGAPRSANRIALQAGLASGGALMAHAGFAGFLLPLFAVVAWDRRSRGDQRPFLCLAAGTGLVLLPWYCWSIAEYGWQRGLLGYFHSAAGSTDVLALVLQKIAILASGIIPVILPQVGLVQDYFLIYLGSAAGLAGVVGLVWISAQCLVRRKSLSDGWKIAFWFAVCGVVTTALLSRQYAITAAGALFIPGLVVLVQLAVGSRKIPVLVILAALLETALFEILLLAWMWSTASASQPNAQLAVAEHVRFLGHSTLPAGIALMVGGAAACLPGLGLPWMLRNRNAQAVTSRPFKRMRAG